MLSSSILTVVTEMETWNISFICKKKRLYSRGLFDGIIFLIYFPKAASSFKLSSACLVNVNVILTSLFQLYSQSTTFSRDNLIHIDFSKTLVSFRLLLWDALVYKHSLRFWSESTIFFSRKEDSSVWNVYNVWSF